ncbi:MAG: hypothetical protein WBN92_13410 [Terriglobia bacterium]
MGEDGCSIDVGVDGFHSTSGTEDPEQGTLMDKPLTLAFRESRYAVALILMTLVPLLFPTFSTADDFHVCRLSIIHLFDSHPAGAAVQSFSSAHPQDDSVCIACLWSTFDSTPPTAPIILNSVPSRNETCLLPETVLPFVQNFSSTTQRAPPLA